MFSDAALAIAVDATSKWLYNASRRLNRPFQRTLADVAWWRLTHHLAGRIGIPLADAARASDLLLGQGSDLSRVRLRSTADDSVAISVDLARFHDGAAVAAAAALHLATPRRRGRPPRARPPGVSYSGFPSGGIGGDESARLTRALAAVLPLTGEGNPGTVAALLSALFESAVPCVVVGSTASVFHGGAPSSSSVDLVADLSARHARSLSLALNRLQAIPRGVHVRDGFQFDPGIVRSAPCLALRVDAIALNISRGLPGVGEFPQVHESSTAVPLGGATHRVISRAALDRSIAALAHAGSPA
jgi:hypothetical protein